MNVLKNRALTLLATLAVAAAGCQGDKGSAGTDGQAGAIGANGANGISGVNGGNTTGLAINVTGVTVDAQNNVTVNFTTKDDQGFPVDLQGKYSVNTVMKPRFALAYVTQAADGSVQPYNVLTKATSHGNLNPTAFAAPAPGVQPDNSTTFGTLVENGTGAGSYNYTFPASAAIVDASKSHVVWIEATRQTNLTNSADPTTFKAVNQEYDFVPGSNATPLKREIVLTSKCSKCHNQFKPDIIATGGFHNATRVQATYCDICHNPARISTLTNSDSVVTSGNVTTGKQGTTACTATAPCACTVANPCTSVPGTVAAFSGIFVHRIHNALNLQTANIFDGVGEVTYPQDLRNCAACHDGAAQGGQSKTTVTRAVCGSCHDYVDFSGRAGLPACTNPVTVGSNGLPVPCFHSPGTGVTQDDTQCAGCHSPGGASYMGEKHIAVAMPDPTNSLIAGQTNTHTNQAWVAAAGQLPPGAIQLKYVMPKDAKGNPIGVTAVRDSTGVLRPQITFKFQQSTDGVNFTDVVFKTFVDSTTTPEMLDNFVGSPSVYFAFSVTQDGIAAPADFNATASAYIKNVWNNTASGTTMTGPDANGFYTIALIGSIVPDNAKMLTGGIGYSYGTTSSQPMTQTNVTGYPYDWNPYTDSALPGMGGLLVPVHDEWQVATGNDGSGKPWAGRRAIVENARCLNCHAALGVNPTFHAGQRNDGPTCTFCHNANQNNSGWAGNAKDFIHGLHAGLQAGTYTLPDGAIVSGGSGVRTVPFGWHALSDTEGYWDVTFPGQHNYCQACHLPGTYDFSAAASSAAVPNMLWSTDATTSTKTPTIAASYGSSPYVNNTVSYGSGFSYSASTGVSTPAASTTLVTSPITAACVACHDSAADRGHMVANGGSFYVARSAATATEQCLICHGPQPGAIAPIGVVHQ